MQIIGHRGCMDHYPQNTIAAIHGCAEHVDMVEIDVQRCGSGEIVVFHDDDLDELTGETGAVRDRSFEELSALAVAGSDETIPSFEALLEALPSNVGINVELKHAGMRDEIAPALRELEQDVLISSFETDATAAFEDEPIPTAHLFMEDPETNLDVAADLGCDFIHPYYKITNRKLIETAHDRGFGVNTWTVPSKEEVTTLRDAGIDGVIVDSWTVVP